MEREKKKGVRETGVGGREGERDGVRERERVNEREESREMDRGTAKI